MMTLIEARTRFPEGSKVQLNEHGRKVYPRGIPTPMTVVAYTTIPDLTNTPIPLLRLCTVDKWGGETRCDVQAALLEVVR